MEHKAFTTIEMMFVLFVMSCIMFLATTSPLPSYEKQELSKIKAYIEYTHRISLAKSTKMQVDFRGTEIDFEGTTLDLRYCKSNSYSLIFYEIGTTNQANTIHFVCRNNNYQMVVHLGSGHIEIKK